MCYSHFPVTSQPGMKTKTTHGEKGLLTLCNRHATIATVTSSRDVWWLCSVTEQVSAPDAPATSITENPEASRRHPISFTVKTSAQLSFFNIHGSILPILFSFHRSSYKAYSNLVSSKSAISVNDKSEKFIPPRPTSDRWSRWQAFLAKILVTLLSLVFKDRICRWLHKLFFCWGTFGSAEHFTRLPVHGSPAVLFDLSP